MENEPVLKEAPETAPARKAPFPLWRSVWFKMTAATTVVLSFILGSALVYALYIERKLEYQDVEHYTTRLAEIILSSFDSGPTGGNPFHTRYLVAKLLELPRLYNVRVIAIDGTIQFSRDQEEIGAPLNLDNRPPCSDCHKGEGITDYSRTYPAPSGAALYHLPFQIPNLPQCLKCHRAEYKFLGTMVVEMEVEPVLQKLFKKRTAMVVSLVLALVLAIIGTALLFRRFVQEPLSRFQKDIRQVEAGNFRFGPPPQSGDEIQEVYESFLAMTRRLEEVQDHLNRLVAEKSARVVDLDQELRRIYADLIRMEHLSAVGTLSAQVVHEVRTPLNSLSLNLQLLHRALLRHPDLEKNVPELAANIGKEVERISTILEQFLDRARRPKAPATEKSMRELVLGVVALMEWEAAKRRTAIRIDLPEEQVTISVNADEIRQVLINLVSNSIQAMPKGGTITVWGRHEGDGYRLAVQDDGIGIAKENTGKIFQPFFTTRETGTGLGLAIVKRLVEEMGGEITVESEVGKGTSFHLWFPQVQRPEKGKT